MSKKEAVLVKLSPKDNVAVALGEMERGAVGDISGDKILIATNLSMGQKVACQDIERGAQVLKYGFPIGFAKVDIVKGDHVHVHNLESNYTKTHSLSETQSGNMGEQV